MRIRLGLGIVVSLAIAAVNGFLIYVALTTDLNTQSVVLIPGFLGLAIGLYLCIRVPDNNIGLVVLVAVLSMSLLSTSSLVSDWGVAHGYATLAIVASIGSTVAFGGVTVTLLVLLPIWFPDGVAIARWARWTARIGVACAVIPALGAIFTESVCVGNLVDSCSRYEVNPWGIPGFDGSVLETLYIVVFLLGIPAMIAVVLRWRRSRGVERAQLKWFSFAAVLFIVGFLVIGTNNSLIGTAPADVMAAAALTGVWLSIGFAVAKYHLYDIDKVISRGLGYTLVVGVLAFVYVVGAVWLPSLLIDQQHPIFVAGSTLAVAALFRPVRRRILRLVDRRFYRSRYNAEIITADFSDRLKTGLDVEELPRDWMDVVTETLKPASVGVWIRPG